MIIKTSTKIFKSGNSNAVRISKDIMSAAGLKANDEIDVTFNSHDGSIVIKPRNDEFHECFSELLNSSLAEDQILLDFLKDK